VVPLPTSKLPAAGVRSSRHRLFFAGYGKRPRHPASGSGLGRNQAGGARRRGSCTRPARGCLRITATFPQNTTLVIRRSDYAGITAGWGGTLVVGECAGRLAGGKIESVKRLAGGRKKNWIKCKVSGRQWAYQWARQLCSCAALVGAPHLRGRGLKANASQSRDLLQKRNIQVMRWTAHGSTAPNQRLLYLTLPIDNAAVERVRCSL